MSFGAKGGNKCKYSLCLWNSFILNPSVAIDSKSLTFSNFIYDIFIGSDETVLRFLEKL